MMKSYTRMDTDFGVIELTLLDHVTLALTAYQKPVGARDPSDTKGHEARLNPEQVDALIHTLQGTRSLMRSECGGTQ